MELIAKYRVSSAGRSLLLWLIVSLAASCTARLDISTRDAEPRIVIYGTITTDHVYHTVNVSSTAGFFSGEESRMIEGARVTVACGETVHVFEELDEGNYVPEVPFAGKEGEEYILTVSIDLDGDGVPEVYRAASVIPPPVSIHEITIRESTAMSNRYEILFWGEVPYDKGYYLSFSIARDSSPFTDSLSKYNILEDRYFGTGFIEGLPCFFLNRESGDRLSEGDVVGMKVDVLPGGYGKFLNDAQSELTGAIPLFSGPPANVGTNIRQLSGSPLGEPLGFFGTSATSRAYTVYEEEKEPPDIIIPMKR